MTDHDPRSDDDDDDEYELEPVDPEILEHERKRGEQKTRQAEFAVDVDKAYTDAEQTDPVSWDDLQRFRFTTRHLLIATALLSVVLTLRKLLGCFGWFLVGASALAAGWYFVLRKERRERLVRDLRREEVERRIAAKRGEEVGELSAEGAADEPRGAVGPAFRFSFSMKEMLGAMTVAAVFFTLVSKFGEPNHAAMLLGIIALAGLAVQLVGFELPPVVVLGWWLLLVLYIIVSIWAALSPASVAWVDGGSSLMMGVVFRS